jgi:hypothetical protein
MKPEDWLAFGVVAIVCVFFIVAVKIVTKPLNTITYRRVLRTMPEPPKTITYELECGHFVAAQVAQRASIPCPECREIARNAATARWGK